MFKLRVRFFKALFFHKLYVFIGGIRVGRIPLWRLVIHDWSKYGLWEFDRYAQNFHGDYSKSAVDRENVSKDFAVAWLHHENFNPHHVGYWIPRTAQYADEPLQMPDTFVREMVADMLGASKAYTGSWEMGEWLEGNLSRLTQHMHSDSIKYLESVLAELGYENVQHLV